MAFQLSAGVNVSEIDLTTVVPSVATSIGAFAGKFAWGPVNEIVTISDEVKFAETFGKPDNDNYEDWFSAANFLAYSNNLKVVRAANTSTFVNASANTTKTFTGVTITSGGENYINTTFVITATDQNLVISNAQIQVTVSNTTGEIVSANVISAGLFESSANLTAQLVGGANAVLSLATTASPNLLIENELDYQQNHSSGSVTYGIFAAKYPGELGNSIQVSMADGSSFSSWDLKSNFPIPPSTSEYVSEQGGANDEIHILVVDKDGKITGTKDTVLEKFSFLSKASDAKLSDGTSNYYKDVLNNRSKYVWWMSHPKSGTNWGTVASNTTFTNTAVVTRDLSSGAAGTVSIGNIETAYDRFVNSDTVDVSLIISGSASSTLANYLIDSIAEIRKDCVVFVSPEKSDVVDNYGDESTDVIAFRENLTSTSYAVLDSGWKYQYDKYNDKYRWIPLNGDIAGLCARTDRERDPWYSPGGLNRGIIKNVVKLAWNPDKAARDDLYSKGVNPVVTFPGEGVILYGDKTLLSRPSAFDRINVRRLFIVLEKAIARAARSSLFEFNDQFTRAQFVNLVEPFLRDVQGRRGITDFRVVCDETNNTGEVIDRNEFVGDIYIKPARSINFIQLNFVAVRTGVSFDEIVGKFG